MELQAALFLPLKMTGLLTEATKGTFDNSMNIYAMFEIRKMETHEKSTKFTYSEKTHNAVINKQLNIFYAER